MTSRLLITRSYNCDLQATHGKQRLHGLAEVEATIRKAIADLTQRADELAAKIKHEADASGAVSQQAEEARQELGNARAIANIESKTFDLLQELLLVSTSSRCAVCHWQAVGHTGRQLDINSPEVAVLYLHVREQAWQWTKLRQCEHRQFSVHHLLTDDATLQQAASSKLLRL